MSKKRFGIQTLSVYVSTTLVLMLFGTMCLLLVVADSLSSHVRKNLTVSLVLNEKLGNDEITKYRSKIDKSIYVADSKYISKEQVLEEQKKELGTDPVEFLGYNPYEASIELSMKPEYANVASLAKIEKELLADKEVKEVIYHKELIDSINSNIHKITAVLLIFLVFLTLISWSLIGNMVRLSIYSRRFLLHTMKLVGATWGFIRRPFLVRNFWIGLIAGILANATLGGGFYLLTQKEPGLLTILPVERLIFVGGIVLLFGITITVLCAFLSVNRFLRMRGNDLYFI